MNCHRCPTKDCAPPSILKTEYAIMGAKLQKKVVTNEGFGRINAIRSKIKAKRRRMRKYENEGNAKLRGLVKELGCQIVTQKWFCE